MELKTLLFLFEDLIRDSERLRSIEVLWRAGELTEDGFDALLGIERDTGGKKSE